MILDSDRPDIVEYLIKTFSENTKFILDPVSAAKAKNIKLIKANKNINSEVFFSFLLSMQMEE